MTSRTKRTIWSVLAVIIVAIVGFAVYYFSSIYNQLDNLHKEGANSPFKNVKQVDQVRTPDPPKWEGTDPVNILLMGVDGRGIQKRGSPPFGQHDGRIAGPRQEKDSPLLYFA